MTMLATYAIGVLGIGAVLAVWLGVQRAWARTFPDAAGDPDALAGRLGCYGCRCTGTCERGSARPGEAHEEERA